MSTDKMFVTTIPVFRQLDGSLQKQLAKAGQILTYNPQEVIVHQNDALTGLYGILSGHVKLYRVSSKRTQILALLRTGDCFGIEILSNERQSSYSVATLTPTQLFFIPETSLHQLLHADAEFRAVLIQLVTSRLRQFATLVHNLAFRNVPARLATILVNRAEEEGIVKDDKIYLPRLLTQRELATLIGTVREVVQRTFKQFEQQGLTQFSRKEIVILDLEGLKKVADEENR